MELDPQSTSTARVYDYLLGGTHNTPADRVMAGILEQRYPWMAQGIQINRWFISYVARTFFGPAGLDCFIDLGAGLPTAGSLHEQVPATAKVLYVDNDPDVVTYSQAILGDRPNTHYIQGTIEDIDPILAEAERLFGGERRIGINLIAVVHFMDDPQLRSIVQDLYDWVAPDSLLAITSAQDHPELPEWRETVTQYEQRTGRRLYHRDPLELQARLYPWWRPVDGDMRPLEEYAEHDLRTSLVEPRYRTMVGYGGIYGRSSNGNGASGTGVTSASSGKK